MELYLEQEMLSTVKVSESSKRRQEVVGGVSEYYKKTLAKITIPHETLTIGKAIGQGIKIQTSFYLLESIFSMP